MAEKAGSVTILFVNGCVKTTSQFTKAQSGNVYRRMEQRGALENLNPVTEKTVSESTRDRMRFHLKGENWCIVFVWRSADLLP